MYISRHFFCLHKLPSCLFTLVAKPRYVTSPSCLFALVATPSCLFTLVAILFVYISRHFFLFTLVAILFIYISRHPVITCFYESILPFFLLLNLKLNGENIYPFCPRMRKSKDSRKAKAASAKILDNYLKSQAISQKLQRESFAIEKISKQGTEGIHNLLREDTHKKSVF